MSVGVWLMASTFEPRGSSLYTLRLASHLTEYDFVPTILCESAARIPAKLRRSLRIREVSGLTSRLWCWSAMRRLVQEWSDEPPALVHAQRRELAWAALECAHRFACPYVVTAHDILPPEESVSVLPERLAALIAVSPTIERDLVLAAGAPQELVHVIPNGVELPIMPKIPEARPAQRIPVVGTASALEEVKGLTYFLMAAELILSSGYDVEFVIAGSGPEEETLRHAAQHLDIANRVTFVGHVPEYTQVIETLDVFVIPSLEQGLGTVMLEAMALGKPVVATRVGGIADFFVDNDHALLVPQANHTLLAQKIKFLLDNPSKARKLAVSGEQFVRKRFSVERMTQETAQLYRQILAS